MCNLRSYVVTRDAVLGSPDDSHETIIKARGLDNSTQTPDFARVELTPHGDACDVNNWVWRVDQDLLPTWWDEADAQRRCREALACELAAGLRVGGSLLNLGGCTGLTSLPDGLQVGGYLDLGGCVGLASLPDGLQVGGSLDLGGCTGLTSLPDGLQVGGEIYR